MGKVEDFLRHYEYDPVKAHEYYMRTRKLKGRTTRGMSDKQKETWSYVNSQISAEKKGKVKAAHDQKEKTIAELRAKGEELRKKIAERLKAMVEAKEKEISDKLKAIPKNVSPETRARLIEQRKKETAKMREDAAVERENLRTNLKDAIATARANFEKTKTTIDATYEKTSQTEYDRVLTKVAGKKQKRRK